MRQIPLNHGYVALIDDEDEEFLSQFTWNSKPDRCGLVYAVTNLIPPGGTRRLTTVRMHKLLLPTTDGQLVDHINGDSLDNRRSNLRPVDRRLSTLNRRRRAGTGDLPKGVSLVYGGKYRIRLGRGGCLFQLQVDTLEEASAVAREQSLRLYGEYSYWARSGV